MSTQPQPEFDAELFAECKPWMILMIAAKIVKLLAMMGFVFAQRLGVSISPRTDSILACCCWFLARGVENYSAWRQSEIVPGNPPLNPSGSLMGKLKIILFLAPSPFYYFADAAMLVILLASLFVWP